MELRITRQGRNISLEVIDQADLETRAYLFPDKHALVDFLLHDPDEILDKIYQAR